MIRYDEGKHRYDLVPWDAVDEIVRVLEFGGGKYPERNWESGGPWSKYLAPAFRHLRSWAMGETNDPESGLNHLAHAACCLLFLLAYAKRGIGDDDRPEI